MMINISKLYINISALFISFSIIMLFEVNTSYAITYDCNNLSHEYTICSAYFAVVSECVKASNNKQDDDNLLNLYSYYSSKAIYISSFFGDCANLK